MGRKVVTLHGAPSILTGKGETAYDSGRQHTWPSLWAGQCSLWSLLELSHLWPVFCETSQARGKAQLRSTSSLSQEPGTPLRRKQGTCSRTHLHVPSLPSSHLGCGLINIQSALPHLCNCLPSPLYSEILKL